MERVLLISPYAEMDEIESITYGMNRWRMGLIDRDALEACAIFENTGNYVEYLPLDLLSKCVSFTELKKIIITTFNEFKPTFVMFFSNFMAEGMAYRGIISILDTYRDILDNIKVAVIGNMPFCMMEELKEKKVSYIGKYQSFYSDSQFYETSGLSNYEYRPFSIIPHYQKIKKYEKQIRFNFTKPWGMYIRTSYGCPYQCDFCSTSSLQKEMIYAEKCFLRKEIETIDTFLGLDNVDFDCIVDDCFGLDEKQIYNTIDLLIEKNIHVEYILMRADIILKRSYYLQQIAKVTNYILIGAETADDEILMNLKKKIRFYDVYQAVILLNICGIKVHLNWMIGLPGETAESLYKNIRWLCYFVKSGLVQENEIQMLCPFPWVSISKDNEKNEYRDMRTVYFNEKSLRYIGMTEKLSSNQIERTFLLSNYLNLFYKNMQWSKKRQEECMQMTYEDVINTYFAGVNYEKGKNTFKKLFLEEGYDI